MFNLDFIINFGRKLKIFCKNKYSRNRQNVKIVYFFSIYFNILIIYLIYNNVYNLSFNFAVYWWVCFCFCLLFILIWYYKSNTDVE